VKMGTKYLLIHPSEDVVIKSSGFTFVETSHPIENKVSEVEMSVVCSTSMVKVFPPNEPPYAVRVFQKCGTEIHYNRLKLRELFWYNSSLWWMNLRRLIWEKLHRDTPTGEEEK